VVVQVVEVEVSRMFVRYEDRCARRCGRSVGGLIDFARCAPAKGSRGPQRRPCGSLQRTSLIVRARVTFEHRCCAVEVMGHQPPAAVGLPPPAGRGVPHLVPAAAHAWVPLQGLRAG
jgi:hypothetical protein